MGGWLCLCLHTELCGVTEPATHEVFTGSLHPRVHWSQLRVVDITQEPATTVLYNCTIPQSADTGELADANGHWSPKVVSVLDQKCESDPSHLLAYPRIAQ